MGALKADYVKRKCLLTIFNLDFNFRFLCFLFQYITVSDGLLFHGDTIYHILIQL